MESHITQEEDAEILLTKVKTEPDSIDVLNETEIERQKSISAEISSPTTSAPKRVLLTYEVKMKMLKEVDEQLLLKKDIAKKYGIPRNTLSCILKNREKIELWSGTEAAASMKKKVRLSPAAEIEKVLIEWYHEAQAQGESVGRQCLEEKAIEIGNERGIKFTPNWSWISRFKKKHGIVLRSLSKCEMRQRKEPVDQKLKNENITLLLNLLNGFSPNNIFFTKETGLLFDCLPDNIDQYKESKCLEDGKMAEHAFTVLLSANMLGREKLPLYVIGKTLSSSLKCSQDNPPVSYTSNNKSVMTKELFDKWIHALDSKFDQDNRTVALVVDKSLAHSEVQNLKAIKLVFPPPGSFPRIQSLVTSFKLLYRKSVLQRYLIHKNLGLPDSCTISTLDALFLMQKAWDDMSDSTVAASFKFSSFQNQSIEIGSILPDTTEFLSIFKLKEEIAFLFKKHQTTLPARCSLQDFIHVDFDIQITEEALSLNLEPTPEDPIEKFEMVESDNVSDSNKNIPSNTMAVTSRDAKAALTLLKKFVMEQDSTLLVNDIFNFELKFDDTIVQKLGHETLSDLSPCQCSKIKMEIP